MSYCEKWLARALKALSSSDDRAITALEEAADDESEALEKKPSKCNTYKATAFSTVE